jgi:twinkle protein
MATENDVHMTLVIHPRKVDENDDIGISSIFGSAKATQEADNIFVIQNREKYRIFEVKKNRFDGELGNTPIVLITLKRKKCIRIQSYNQILF